MKKVPISGSIPGMLVLATVQPGKTSSLFFNGQKLLAGPNFPGVT